MLKSKKVNTKKAKAEKEMTEEDRAFEEFKDSIEELKFMVMFSTGNTLASRKQMTRLERNKSSFLKYVDMIASGKCQFVICPRSKAAIKIWNEKMMESGKEELYIEDIKALQKSIDTDVKDWKAERRSDKKNIRKARKMVQEEIKENRKKINNSPILKGFKFKRKETNNETNQEEKKVKKAKKDRKPIFKGFGKKRNNDDIKKEDLTNEDIVDIIDEMFAEQENPKEDTPETTDPSEPVADIVSETISEEVIKGESEESEPVTEEAVLVEEPDQKEEIVEDSNQEDEAGETKTVEEFDANTGFVEPAFETSKVSPITFNNDNLSKATYDGNGNLVVDEIEMSYNHFVALYPQIETIYNMAKTANYRAFFYEYLDPNRTPIPVPGLLGVDFISVDGAVANQLILDINCIYGNGLMVLSSGNGKTLLEEMAVSITDPDRVYAMICRGMTKDEIEQAISEYPEEFRNILYHVDMSSLQRVKATKFNNRQHYNKLLSALNQIFNEEEWEDRSLIDARFRFDRYKSVDNFDLICDEWVNFIPDVNVKAPANHYETAKKRFWVSYNGKKKEKITTGYLQVPANNPNAVNDTDEAK